MDLYLAPTITAGSATAAAPSSVEKDRVAFDLPSHTAKEPRVMIVSRSPSSGGPKGVSVYTAKAVYGDLNTDDTPRSGNVIVELKVRIPDDQPASLAEEAVDGIRGLLINTTVMDTIIEKGRLPYA